MTLNKSEVLCRYLGHPIVRGPRALLVPQASRGVKPALRRGMEIFLKPVGVDGV